MLRYLPVLIELGLLVYCLIDIIQTPEGEVRNLPKFGWIVLLILVPIIGGIAWLVAGRPVAPRRAVAWPAGPTAGFPEYERPVRGPDDDTEYLAGLDRADREHEETLRKWEADLKRREQRLRGDGEDDEDDTAKG